MDLLMPVPTVHSHYTQRECTTGGLLGVFHLCLDHWRLLAALWGRDAKPLVSPV